MSQPMSLKNLEVNMAHERVKKQQEQLLNDWLGSAKHVLPQTADNDTVYAVRQCYKMKSTKNLTQAQRKQIEKFLGKVKKGTNTRRETLDIFNLHKKLARQQKATKA